MENLTRTVINDNLIYFLTKHMIAAYSHFKSHYFSG